MLNICKISNKLRQVKFQHNNPLTNGVSLEWDCLTDHNVSHIYRNSFCIWMGEFLGNQFENNYFCHFIWWHRMIHFTFFYYKVLVQMLLSHPHQTIDSVFTLWICAAVSLGSLTFPEWRSDYNNYSSIISHPEVWMLFTQLPSLTYSRLSLLSSFI